MHSSPLGLPALALVAMLAGCATVDPTAGHADVAALAGERIGATVTPPSAGAAAEAVTRDLLARPLSVEAAVQVALLNNASLQAAFAGLGVDAADLAQAARLPNPRFAYDSKRNADLVTIDRAVVVSVLALLTMPLATEVARRQFQARKLEVAADVVRLVHETRRAWLVAVAAEETLRYARKVKVAADAAGDLAQRMERAGNYSALARLREEAFASDATVELAAATLAAGTAREDLVRLMGLEGTATFALPERLPDLPAAPIAPTTVESALAESRLDVMAARQALDATAARLGLTRATRFVNVLEVGYVNESQTGERRQNGYAIEIEIPLFDWGDARLARVQGEYLRSVQRLRATTLAAQSELRARHATYRTRYDLARYYRSDIVPQRERMAEESLLRYNAMQIGVFELLAEARAQVAAVMAAIAASRDFWLADADLAMAMRGTGAAPSLVEAAPGPQALRATGGH